MTGTCLRNATFRWKITGSECWILIKSIVRTFWSIGGLWWAFFWHIGALDVGLFTEGITLKCTSYWTGRCLWCRLGSDCLRSRICLRLWDNYGWSCLHWFANLPWSVSVHFRFFRSPDSSFWHISRLMPKADVQWYARWLCFRQSPEKVRTLTKNQTLWVLMLNVKCIIRGGRWYPKLTMAVVRMGLKLMGSLFLSVTSRSWCPDSLELL